MDISEPVLLALLACPTVQRMKRLGQYGVPNRYYHLKNFSRYEHCVGVMFLLRKLGASLEEQIAGLLHDASHTAFSHVADWIVGSDTSQNFQDSQHGSYILRTEVPEILKKHGFDVKKIVDLKKYPLLDSEVPKLCVDRIDYALRQCTKEKAEKILNTLAVKDGKIYFTDITHALLFGNHYMQRQMKHWAGFESMNRYAILAGIVKRAVSNKALVFDDLWSDDEAAIQKIESMDDEQVKRDLWILSHKSLDQFPKNKNKILHTKFRWVDPLFMQNGKLKRLTLVDVRYRKLVSTAKSVCEQGVFAVDTEAVHVSESARLHTEA